MTLATRAAAAQRWASKNPFGARCYVQPKAGRPVMTCGGRVAAMPKPSANHARFHVEGQNFLRRSAPTDARLPSAAANGFSRQPGPCRCTPLAAAQGLKLDFHLVGKFKGAIKSIVANGVTTPTPAKFTGYKAVFLDGSTAEDGIRNYLSGHNDEAFLPEAMDVFTRLVAISTN